MPTYEYRCANGHTFEVMQRMADDPITVCEVCSSPVERVFHPVAVHFKGSGFYATDYGRARGGGGDSASKDGSKDASKETATSKADSSKTDSSAGASSSSGSSDSGSSGSSSDSGSSAKSD